MALGSQFCKICGKSSFEDIAEFRLLPRVTSDCFSFRSGGRLLVCAKCGAAQSPADDQWFGEIREIYSTYNSYHQAGGVEQHVLDPATRALRRRSDVLLERLSELPFVPSQGRVLDVGCGTGGTLKTFSVHGGWRLNGLDQDDRHLPFLTPLANFENLYTCAPEQLNERFDLVTMVHSLEHFPDPLNTLRSLRKSIAPNGRIFVEVPNAAANPFEYLVADHMVHFDPSSLSALATAAGFEVDCIATTWVTKELSLVAKPGGPPIKLSEATPDAAENVVKRVNAQINWLSKFVEDAREASNTGAKRFGLFGTSIAAVWLSNALGDHVSFFVDEDLHRVGRDFMGRPVYSTDQVPDGGVLYLALVPEIAEKVAKRLRDKRLDLRLPPLL